MPKTKRNDHPFLFAVEPEPPLAEAEFPHPLKTTLDAQTPNPVENFQAAKNRLDAHKRKTGRLDAQRGTFDASEEMRYPSRIKDERFNGRLNTDLMEKVRQELKTQPGKPPKMKYVIEDGLRLWLGVRAQARLGVQTPTSSSSGCSSSSDLDQNINQTTTTTTLDAQPKRQPLPGFAADIADIPHKSRHRFEVLIAYAWDAENDFINKPDIWTLSAYRTGKHDVLVDLWVDRKELAVVAKRQREEAAVRQRQVELEQLERTMREREERRANGETEEDEIRRALGYHAPDGDQQ